jgi:phage terminase large subunit-like protein
MSLGLTREQFLSFVRMEPKLQRTLIAELSPADALAFDADFEFWAAKGQLPPPEDGWRTWLMMAGRGFGKTRAGAEWVHRLAGSRPMRIALVAATIDEARAVMVEGVSGILSVARRRRQRVKWEPSLGKLTWARGTVAQLFSGDNADGLRGPEHHIAWCDELAKWRQADATWDNLQMGLRAGPRPRALVTTTPRSIKLLKRIGQDPRTVKTGGRTSDNVSLPRSFVDVMMDTYAGTRLGRQELDGVLIEDVEGSLWPRELIERARVGPLQHPSDGPPPRGKLGEEFERIVVGVDPPAGVGEGCDACGIVVAGRREGRLYVLSDESCQGMSPDGWANRVAATVARWDADMVVAEANNGGAMVGSVLKAAEIGVRVRLVHASRGKAARAEPIALRFESGRAFFAGSFPELEDELSGLTAGGGYEGPSRSPDRADAMVWAMTELSETRSGVPGVRRL